MTNYSKIDCSSKSEAGIVGVYLFGHQVRNEENVLWSVRKSI